MSSEAVATRTPSLPDPKLGRALREAGWILLLGVAAWLALVLFTYHRADPGPFHSGTGEAIANRGGAAGAWIAETLLYLFGLSAWWFVGLAIYGSLRLYRRVEAWELLNRRSLAVALVGFALVLGTSCAFEALRLHTLNVQLPGEPGGVLGSVLASISSRGLGFTGARCS